MTENKFFNFLLFQFGWLVCVTSAATDLHWVGSGIAVLIIIAHILGSQRQNQEWLLIIAVMTVGVVWDSVLVWQNWLAYPYGMLFANTAPYWIVIMWGLFAITLNHSLAWLKNRVFLAILLGGVAGPLAYYAGSKLGAVEFVDVETALTVLAIGWAVLTPVLLKSADQLQRNKVRILRSAS